MNTISDFYSLYSNNSSIAVQVSSVGLNLDGKKNGYYDEPRIIMGDFNNLNFPIKFNQVYGKKFEDILETGYPSLYLISGRLKLEFEKNNLSGWTTYPVEVMDLKNQKILNYFGFSIIGRCGKIDYSKSPIIEKRFYQDGQLSTYYKGLYIGLDKWDGSDFFLPENSFGCIVTKKVFKIFKENNIQNLKFELLSEIETKCSIVKK